MKPVRSLVLALILALTAAFGLPAAALAQTPSTACSASFHVLHDDRIGRLTLPAGLYTLTPKSGRQAITCARASSLFTQFLRDYDGVLPRPWTYSAQGDGEGTFDRGDGQSFTAVRSGDAGPDNPGNGGSHADGGGTHGALLCPGDFEVKNNDRIGRLSLPRGDYQISLLGANLSCATAVKLFRRFLNRPSGRLGGQWVVLPAAGEFVNGSTLNGFYVKRLVQ
jgi:hypothetical protein